MRALLSAQAEPDFRRRTELTESILKSWARTDPEAAARWTLTQRTLEHRQALVTVLSEAAAQPKTAVQLVDKLSQENPAAAREYNTCLVLALDQNHKFDLAADIAVNGGANFRHDLLTWAYFNWGQEQPEVAAASALKLEDPVAREDAFQAAFSGWSRTDPEGLAEMALNFPAGPEQQAALTKAIRAWMIKDPWKAGDWILAHDDVLPAATTALRKD